MNKLFKFLPARFQWTIRNVIGHPVCEILYQFGFNELSDKIHIMTTPPGHNNAL